MPRITFTITNTELKDAKKAAEATGDKRPGVWAARQFRLGLRAQRGYGTHAGLVDLRTHSEIDIRPKGIFVKAN